MYVCLHVHVYVDRHMCLYVCMPVQVYAYILESIFMNVYMHVDILVCSSSGCPNKFMLYLHLHACTACCLTCTRSYLLYIKIDLL